ncbi:MAG: N-acetyltransferase family protein [Robiginitomaculum sp.]
MKIVKFHDTDYPRVKDIYQQGIDTGQATFQTRAKEWEQWDASMMTKCRLVARHDSEVLGWAALSAVSNRCVHAGVAEVSVYVGQIVQRQGVGSQLLGGLIACSENEGIWTLQAGMFPENIGSIALHKKHGFKILGTREKLGQMHGKWRDITLMERRSKTIGV